MIHGHDGVIHAEEGQRQAVRVVGSARHGLKGAGGLVAQVADRAAKEGRQGAGAAGDEPAPGALRAQGAQRVGVVRPHAQHALRICAEEAVARRPLAPMHALQQEAVAGVRGARAQLEVGRHGGIQVGGQPADDWRAGRGPPPVARSVSARRRKAPKSGVTPETRPATGAAPRVRTTLMICLPAGGDHKTPAPAQVATPKGTRAEAGSWCHPCSASARRRRA